MREWDGLKPVAEYERELLRMLLSGAGVADPEGIIEVFFRERERYCEQLLRELVQADQHVAPKVAEKLARSPNYFDKTLGLWLLDRATRPAWIMYV